jgi:hypothetical protein
MHCRTSDTIVPNKLMFIIDKSVIFITAISLTTLLRPLRFNIFLSKNMRIGKNSVKRLIILETLIFLFRIARTWDFNEPSIIKPLFT